MEIGSKWMSNIWIQFPPQLLLHCKLLREAASLVLKDEGFAIPLESARRVCVMTERYLEW